MKNVLFVFLIFCFILTIISCSDDKEESTETATQPPLTTTTSTWTKQLGSSGEDNAYGVATDSSGNVYVTGSTRGGLDGNTSAGSYDLFVVKYNSDGEKY